MWMFSDDLLALREAQRGLAKASPYKDLAVNLCALCVLCLCGESCKRPPQNIGGLLRSTLCYHGKQGELPALEVRAYNGQDERNLAGESWDGCMDMLSDANFVYFLLMAGMWVSATGTYIPGTGVAEIVGIALIVGSLYLMSLLAVNWLAVLALVAGASLFFLLPLLKSEWESFAIAGLAIQAVASFFLFSEASVSPLFIAVGVILAFAYHRGILRSILQQQRELSSTQKDEFLVGARGRVMAAIEDRGTVQVKGELWTARSRSRLETGTEIVVTQQEGLELHVEKAKRQAAD